MKVKTVAFIAGLLAEAYLCDILISALLELAPDNLFTTALTIGLCSIGMAGTAIFIVHLIRGRGDN